MGQVIGGVVLGGPDILRGYVPMAFDNLLDAIAGAEAGGGCVRP